MKKFTIRIKEELVRDIVINAENDKEALEKAKYQYDGGYHVLDSRDKLNDTLSIVEDTEDTAKDVEETTEEPKKPAAKKAPKKTTKEEK